MARAKVTEEMREDFDLFLTEMDFLFEDLEAAMANTPHGGAVAFDDDSLTRIEGFYLSVLAGKQRTSMSVQRLDRIITAFYGEAMRVRAGQGTWVLVEEGDNRGTPAVAGWANDAIDFNPVVSRELQKEDHEPFIVQSVNYAVNRDQIHANFFDDL